MPATQRLRSACDSCHRLKVRCSGSKPCAGCAATHTACVYSLSNRLGRPAGSRNKRDDAKATGSTEKRLFDRRGREAHRPLTIPGAAPWTSSPTLGDTSESGMSLDDGSDIAPPSAQYTAIPNARPLGSAGMLPQKTWNPGFQALSPPPSATPSNIPSEEYYTHMLKDLQNRREPRGSFVAHPPAQPTQLDTLEHLLGPEANVTTELPEPTARIDCECMQRQIALLGQLKRPGFSGSGEEASLSSALTRARDAQKTWVDLASCDSCMRGDDQEVLLLALMCIRLVLSQLRGVCPVSGSRNADTTMRDSDGVPVLVGDFEVTGDDRLVLLHVLRSIEVKKVEAMLDKINDAFKRKRASRASVIGRGGPAPDVELLVSESDEIIGRLSRMAESLRAGGAQG